MKSVECLRKYSGSRTALKRQNFAILWVNFWRGRRSITLHFQCLPKFALKMFHQVFYKCKWIHRWIYVKHPIMPVNSYSNPNQSLIVSWTFYNQVIIWHFAPSESMLKNPSFLGENCFNPFWYSWFWNF